MFRLGRGVVTLRVILRLTPSENLKNRPAWYSKQTCLRSLLAAVRTAREAGFSVEFLVFIDVSSGRQLSPGVAQLLTDADAIMPLYGGTAAKSWRPVVRTVRASVPFDDDDLLYFIEDDYLHHPEALLRLLDGTADYRLLYVPEDENFATGPLHGGWAAVDTSTSSFAVTGKAFRKDAAMHLFFSHGGGAWDELCWRALGSRVCPPRWLPYVLQPFSRASQWSRKWGLRPVRHAVFRMLALSHATRRSRAIEVRLPMPATHGEQSLLASGSDWSALADSITAAEKISEKQPAPSASTQPLTDIHPEGDAPDRLAVRLVARCDSGLESALARAIAPGSAVSMTVSDGAAALRRTPG